MVTIRAYNKSGAQVFFVRVERDEAAAAMGAMLDRDDVRSVKITKGR